MTNVANIKVTIQRTHLRVDGTFGVLDINGLPICVTLERVWADNKKGESCIPAGCYVARRVLSPKFGNTFEITGVNGRDAILFHWGNIDLDSHGCVLLGESFHIWNAGQCSIASSKVAFAEFMQRLGKTKEFDVEIFNPRT